MKFALFLMTFVSAVAMAENGGYDQMNLSDKPSCAANILQSSVQLKKIAAQVSREAAAAIGSEGEYPNRDDVAVWNSAGLIAQGIDLLKQRKLDEGSERRVLLGICRLKTVDAATVYSLLANMSAE